MILLKRCGVYRDAQRIFLRRARTMIDLARRWRPVRSNKGFGLMTVAGEGISNRLRM